MTDPPICKALQSLAKCWDAAEPATQDLQEYDVKVVFMDLSVISGSHDGMHPSQHPFPIGGTVSGAIWAGFPHLAL